MKFTPVFVEGLSGSVGGLTASRARGGVDYFRVRAIPVNPNTARQQTVRQALAQLSVLWGTSLSQANRDTWINEADGSEQQGLNLYIRSNVFRLQAGLARVDSLGAATAISVSTVTVTQSIGAGRSIAFDNTDSWANEDDAGLIVWETRPVPPSRTFEQRERFLRVVLGNSGTAPTSPQTATSPWGNIASSGDQLRFRGVVSLASGRFVAVPIAPDTAA